MCRPGGHENFATCKRARRVRYFTGKFSGHARGNYVGLLHPPGAKLAAGHVSIGRLQNANAVSDQLGKIALRGGVRPHAHIHGRGNHHRLVGCQQGCACQIIGRAMRHARHNISRGRCHENKVGIARQLDMAHFGLIRQIEEIFINPVARHARKR